MSSEPKFFCRYCDQEVNTRNLKHHLLNCSIRQITEDLALTSISEDEAKDRQIVMSGRNRVVDCSVCLKAMVRSDLLTELGCRHQFHSVCLGKCFAAQAIRRQSCPICRSKTAMHWSFFAKCLRSDDSHLGLDSQSYQRVSYSGHKYRVSDTPGWALKYRIE